MLFRKLFVSIVVLLIGLLILPVAAADFQEGNMYHGFKLIEKKFVNEVNAECLLFEHVKSGARLFKIVSDDANKTFSIAFKTVPESDCGTPHIMEHSVLNGSKNFPVKSPFDVLAKGSLNTFLNAMTSGDRTAYPIASMNEKDYFNLMHVYLDAVFNPLIYDDPRILKQEGWHYELTGKDDPVEYKGVVYNEMKGSFSSPGRELYYQVNKNLFPDNGYGFTSGGYPPAIPKLTYEDFLNFHRKYYHPSNSYIFLYGDADLEKELEFIDSQYLAGYDKPDTKITIPLQKPFAAMKKVTAGYPVAEGASTEDQTFLSLNMVTGQNTDLALVMALDVLNDVLINHEAAPVRLALQEAGIGKDVSATIYTQKQIVFHIEVKNANPADAEKFHEIVVKTMRESAEKGFDKKTIEGFINRSEFRLREGDTPQKGLTYNFRLLPSWFFADDPFRGLEYEKTLTEVKAALTTKYLEEIMTKYLLDNPHSLLLVLEPEPGLANKNQEKSEAELAAYKESLDIDAQEALIKETEKLIAYQKREDTPEALETIPVLDLKDINKDVEWYSVSESEIAGTKLLFHEEFTNKIVYMKLYFNAQVIPVELIPYASLLTEMLSSLNTKNYTYGELDNELNIHTGGFSTSVDAYMKDRGDENLLPKYIVTAKATNEKLDKLFDLTDEILNRTIFDDTERLKAVLTRHQSRIESRVKRDGRHYAITRQSSYYSNNGMFDELCDGAEYYWFITKLVNDFDNNVDDIKKKLAQVSSLLFSKENLTAGVTCAADHLELFKTRLDGFLKKLPSTKVDEKPWVFNFEKKNEGFLTASKVQYVIKGYDYKKLGYEYDGRMRVLNQILSREYLRTQIRVIGGAYGGYAVIYASGNTYFASYRDPNLKETLDNYNATPEYLKEFDADDKEMTRYIIGTISRMDRPLTPSRKGTLAFRRYFEGTSKDYVQKERDAVLVTTPEDIRKMEKMISDILSQDSHCVYGNEEKIKENKDQFGKIVEIIAKDEKLVQ